MIALVFALGLQAAPPPTPLMGQRIDQAAAAAQGLQGLLDGGWRLRDRRGATLYDVQITDRPTGGAPTGAWAEPKVGGQAGVVEDLERHGATLILRFASPRSVTANLHRVSARLWTGWLTSGDHRRAVTMSR